MANARIGALRVDLGMNTAAFEKGVSLAERKLNDFSKRTKVLGDQLQGFGKRMSIAVTAPIAAAGAAFVHSAGQMAEEAKNMRTAAMVAGEGFEEFQRQAYAASEVGIEFDKLGDIFKDTRERVGEFVVGGTGPLQDAFDAVSGKVKLTVDELRGLSGKDALQLIVARMEEAKLSTEEMSFVLESLGSDATNLLPLLRDNAKGFDELGKKASIITEKDAEGLERYRQAQKELANATRELTIALVNSGVLDAITDFAKGAADIAERLSKTNPGLLKFSVAAAAIAAAIGPLAFGIGSLVSMFASVTSVMAPLIAVIGTAFSTGGVFVGATAAVTGLAAAFGPLLLIVGGIAAAGALIYANWDKIAPVFETLKTRFEEALGPRIQEAFQKVKAIATELWEGPFGEGIRKAIDFIGRFQAAYLGALGEVLVRVLSAAVELVAGAFLQIGNAINLVVSLLTGDWAGAWDAAKSIVTTSLDTLMGVIDSVFPGAEATIRRTVEAIKRWLGSVLGGVFDGVKRKIHEVNDAFYWLYDQVVGHSHVPDMVDGIAREMARLDTVMADPARKAAQSVNDAMRDMASKTQALLARLFPEVEKARQMAADLALLRGSLSGQELRAAERRLQNEYYGSDGKSPIKTVSLDFPKIIEIADATEKTADKTQTQTVRIAESFKDMAQGVSSAIKGMVGSIKGGDFFDILDAAVGLFAQLGSLGLFGGGVSSKLNSTFSGGGGVNRSSPSHGGGNNGGGMRNSIDGSRANGGPVIAGKSYLVGERGPEIVTPTRNGFVHPNSAMGGGLNVTVTMDESTGRLATFVRNQAGQVVAQAAAPISDMGAAKGQAQMRERQNRSLVA